MTLKTQRVATLEQVRAFLDGSEPVDFADADLEGVYTLVRLDYHRPGKPDKGLAGRYLGKVTGCWRVTHRPAPLAGLSPTNSTGPIADCFTGRKRLGPRA